MGSNVGIAEQGLVLVNRLVTDRFAANYNVRPNDVVAENYPQILVLFYYP